jgi:glyoxylase-like metal-dependent hydrolase (beta-lactamase superfamily II)
VLPAPAERIHTLEDRADVRLGSRRLTALHTPGHARHHLVYVDEAAGDVFAGDAAGVALPGTRYVRPPTPPPELDVPAWDATIDRLRAIRARRLLLTHFGAHTWADELLTQLQRRLHDAVTLVQAALAEGLDEMAVEQRLQAAAVVEMSATGRSDSPRLFEYIMSTRQSAQGLIRYATVRR